MPGKYALSLIALASVTWLILVCVLAERFNVPSSDGILYSLPFASFRNPLHFGIPFLDNFGNYGEVWGHHWPGAMCLKSAVFSILPYSRGADVALLSIFQLLAALTAAHIVWGAGRRWFPAAITLILVLSDRILLLSCAGNRFESIAVAVVLLLFATTQAVSGSKACRWSAMGLAFLCPTLHPYAMVLGAIILGFDLLRFRNQENTPRWRNADRILAYLAGCGVLALWFLAQPEALQQLEANMRLQKTFYQSWNSVFNGLGNYRLGGGIALWGTGVILSCLWIFGGARSLPAGDDRRRQGIVVIAILFLTVIVVHTVTRCENFHYLAFGAPFAAILIGTAASHASASGPAFRGIALALAAGLTAMHAILLPYRLLQFKQARMPDLSADYAAVLHAIPPGRTVYIPHPMWPAAVSDSRHRILWFTFPIASRKEIRQRYECIAYKRAVPGDILIVDNQGATGIDRFGLYPTFPIHPPDPATWQHLEDHKRIFAGSVPWGIDLSVYERRLPDEANSGIR